MGRGTFRRVRNTDREYRSSGQTCIYFGKCRVRQACSRLRNTEAAAGPAYTSVIAGRGRPAVGSGIPKQQANLLMQPAREYRSSGQTCIYFGKCRERQACSRLGNTEAAAQPAYTSVIAGRGRPAAASVYGRMRRCTGQRKSSMLR